MKLGNAGSCPVHPTTEIFGVGTGGTLEHDVLLALYTPLSRRSLIADNVGED